MKQYIVFAGVNGAGKTTLYQTYPSLQKMPRVNVDELVREFGSWKNSGDVTRAGIIAVRKIKSLQKDLTFTSPSQAASFVLFASTNGLISWMDEKGNTLKSLQG